MSSEDLAKLSTAHEDLPNAIRDALKEVFNKHKKVIGNSFLSSLFFRAVNNVSANLNISFILQNYADPEQAAETYFKFMQKLEVDELLILDGMLPTYGDEKFAEKFWSKHSELAAQDLAKQKSAAAIMRDIFKDIEND